uniref:Caspase domain-containing protein n=1 Tax=Candidatus Kentrum sp. FW TaxID=2126338 RepID=A0A450SY58_9GAMM|nr:MAG: Caspase domain-containing protein [Candidatus Kentron sp. FW]VFJ58829.1 MAG: Caspase domain-containing protein [Candidatus Kentron sp. FW]
MKRVVIIGVFLFLGWFYSPAFADYHDLVSGPAIEQSQEQWIGQEISPPIQGPDRFMALVEIIFWNTVRSSDSTAMYRTYLRHYPVGYFVPLALSRIEELNSQNKKVLPEKDTYDKSVFGDYHALIIGNNEYEHWAPLKNAQRDAEALSKILKDGYGFEVTLLLDATRKDILTELGRFRRALKDSDNLLIYYAGHGHLDEPTDQGYWIPVDADKDNIVNWVRNDAITGGVKALSAKHVLVVSDSCYSGKLIRGVKRIGLDDNRKFFESMAQKKARTVMTSGGLEPVLDGGGKRGLSIFATAFIDALDQADQVVDATTLFAGIRRKVRLNSDQTPEYSNIRKAGHDSGDFLFVRQ